MGHLYSILMVLAATPLWAADSAAIVDSGSTNTAGFRIVVNRSGAADYAAKSTTKSRKVPGELLKRFYSDLDGAKPLSEMPKQHCLKSASFGTTRTLEYDGEHTPDLSCRGTDNRKLRALIQDVDQIVKLFNETE